MSRQKELDAVRDYLVSEGHVNIAELLDYYEYQMAGQPRVTVVEFRDHEGQVHKVPTDIDFYTLMINLPPVEYGDDE